MLKVFASSFLCIWNQMPWKNLKTIVLPQDFYHVLLWWFNEYSECENFLNFRLDTIKSRELYTLTAIAVRVIPLYFLMILRLSLLGKRRMQLFVHFSSVFCLNTVLHNQRNMSSNVLIFHTSRGIPLTPTAFLLLIFNKSSLDAKW